MTVLATWRNGDDRYVAMGTKVYSYDEEVLVLRPKMRYPACLRFMPYVEDFEEDNVSREDIEATYGPPPTRDRRSPMKVWSMRWTDGDFEYITIGTSKTHMPTYVIDGGKLNPFEMMYYPACETMMVYVEMLDPLVQVELDDLVARYGDVPPMEPQGVPLDVLASSVNPDDELSMLHRMEHPEPLDEAVVDPLAIP